MKFTYSKIQRILDLIDNRLKDIGERTTYLTAATDDFAKETPEYKEKKDLEDLRNDLIAVVSQAEFEINLRVIKQEPVVTTPITGTLVK
jgi:hypothetical protein